MNTMDQIKVKYRPDGEAVPLSVFLKEKNLSGLPQKIQESIQVLYQLNEKNPPLFQFPDFPADKPLTIDCITPTDDDCMAGYRSGEHIIEFVRNLHDHPHLEYFSFTEILAHELTHAEQDSEEVNSVSHTSTYRFRQIECLKEAQADVKQLKVHALIYKDPYDLKILKLLSMPKGETACVQVMLKQVFESAYYMNRFADQMAIQENDPPLQTIPKTFRLEESLLTTLEQMPIRIDEQSIPYLYEHPDEIKQYFSDFNNKDSSRSVCAMRLMNKLLINPNANQETLEKDLTYINFLLTLPNQEGKSLFADHMLCAFLNICCRRKGIPCQVFLNADQAIDQEGKKIFPPHFSEKVNDMTILDFSECIHPCLKRLSERKERATSAPCLSPLFKNGGRD